MSDITEARIALENIEHTLKIRWWIFGAIAIAISLNAFSNCYNAQAIHRLEESTNTINSRSVENKAAVEAAMKQQIIYQSQLAQIMDKMSKDNPKVRVPRAVVRPPSSVPRMTPQPDTVTVTADPLSDAELTRSTSAKKPTPASRRHRARAKPTSTPSFIQRLFKPKSTR